MARHKSRRRPASQNLGVKPLALTYPVNKTARTATMQLTSILLYVTSAAALGINCRGSGFCSINGASIQQVKDQVGVLIAGGGRDRRFNTGRTIHATPFLSLSPTLSPVVSGSTKES